MYYNSVYTYGKNKDADLVEDEIELLTEPGFIGINLKTSKLINDKLINYISRVLIKL